MLSDYYSRITSYTECWVSTTVGSRVTQNVGCLLQSDHELQRMLGVYYSRITSNVGCLLQSDHELHRILGDYYSSSSSSSSSSKTDHLAHF